MGHGVLSMSDQWLRRLVEIDEKWEKVDGVVYHCYRIVPETEWTRRATAFKEIPVIVMKVESARLEGAE